MMVCVDSELPFFKHRVLYALPQYTEFSIVANILAI